MHEDPDTCLANIRIDLKSTTQDILNFVKRRTIFFHTSICKQQYRKSQVNDVELLCFCLTLWIEGSTSKAVYQEGQKEYNVYNCSRCNNWYHKACLKTCGFKIPGRKVDFICCHCELPETVEWSHKVFTNTCTADNFLSIILLHCRQHSEFLNKIGTSTSERALKAGVKLMTDGQLAEGKTVILQHVKSEASVQNYESGHQKVDCYGHEYVEFLSFLKHVWRVHIRKRCPSVFCPRIKMMKFEIYITTVFIHPLHKIFRSR